MRNSLVRHQFVNRPCKIAFIVMLLAIFTWAQPSYAEKKKWGNRAAPVVVILAAERFLSPTIQVPGTVVSRQQSDLPAEVNGKLDWVAEIGAQLKLGDSVARLDDALYRLKASENRATLSREKSRLKYLDKELKRIRTLIKGSFSSTGELDKVILDRDIALSEINVATARVKVDEETLNRYNIRAPFGGIILRRAKKEGEWIGSGETVVTLSNPKRLEIEARVSEKSIIHLKVGQNVPVMASGNISSIGIVRAIVGVGDAQSHLFEIRIDLPNEDNKWIAGKTVRVDVPIGNPRKVLSVPRDALVLRRSGVSLFRINAENKSEKISIRTGITGGDQIEIIGDLHPGDKVVTRGNERLRPGQTVKITNLKNPSHLKNDKAS